jgi:hypothetical protein
MASPDSDRAALLGEAYKRGILPPDLKSAYEEAQKRGLLKDAPMSWGDVGISAVENIPSSAANFAGSMAQPFLHPVETAENFGAIGKGLLQKAGVVSGSDDEKYADAVGKFFADRYGGIENLKRTLATDPVGAAADVATVLSGGEMALARAPGMIGRVGQAAGAAARAVDPSRAVAALGKPVSEVLGVTTGAGGEAIRTAAKAGAQGGAPAKAFRDAMTGAEPVEGVVDDARRSITQLRQQRGQAYREGMAKVGADRTVLDFGKIDDAVEGANRIKTFKGQSLSPSTEAIRSKIADTIGAWKNLNPEDFHTAEGLDALKQKIGDIRDAAQYGTPERVAADEMYRAVRQTIVDQAPEYAKIMKGYETASDEIKGIEKELSVNPKASIDTALRKITSALRDNVNANFGRRKELVEFLVQSGAPHLIEKIAGQSLKSLMPQGLARLAVSGEGAGGIAALLTGYPALAAKLVATIAAHSPRLVGEAAYGIGKASRFPAARTARAAFQGGRLDQALDNSGDGATGALQ